MPARALSGVWLERGTAWWLEGRPAENGRVVLMKAEPGRRARRRHTRRVQRADDGARVRRRRVLRPRGHRLLLELRGSAPLSHRSRRRAGCRSRRPSSGSRSSLRGRTRHAGRTPVDRRPRAARRGRALAGRRQRARRDTDGRLRRADARSPAGATSTRTRASHPTAARLCFLAWNLPWMPWDGCELFVADLASRRDARRRRRTSPGVTARSRSGSPSGARRAISCSRATAAAGGTSSASATASEASSTRRRPSSAIRRGSSARARSRSSTTGGCSSPYDAGGRTSFGLLDPGDGRAGRPRPPVRRAVELAVGRSGGVDRRLRRGIGHDPERGRPARRLERARRRRCRTSSQVAGRHFVLLGAARDRVPDRGRPHRARALLSALEPGARRRRRTTRPPLLVMSHGGPTSHATAIFDLEIQFWTSRGFAVVDVNYGGSTGYGRAYRERLNGQWGVVDLQDCVNAARYLVAEGEADAERLLITRRERRRLHDDLRAHVHGRVRGRRVLLRDRRPRAVRRRRDAQVRARVRAHARRARTPRRRSSTGPGARSTSSTRSQRRCSSSRAPTTWWSRLRRRS